MNDETIFTRPLIAASAFQALVGFNPDVLGRHTVVAGDTLPTIAAQWYGAARSELWALVAQVNGLLGPTGLAVGQVVVMPDPGWRAV